MVGSLPSLSLLDLFALICFFCTAILDCVTRDTASHKTVHICITLNKMVIVTCTLQMTPTGEDYD